MKTPPKFITNLIERLTDARESEIILGDMYEEYVQRVNSMGKFRANSLYLFDFASLLTHRVLKNKRSRSNSFTMLTNYLKIAFRQLGRQKLHNTINIAGLAIGLAVTFIISLFVQQELSYDKFHEKKDRLYLVPMTWKFGTSIVPVFYSTSGVGPLMKDLFSKEIVQYTRVQPMSMTFRSEQGPVEEKKILAADSTFFELFTFPLISGNPREALKEPNSMVITEQGAKKFFGEDWKSKDVMSETLVRQNGKVYKITGIAKNPPVESHLQFDLLMSMSSLRKKDTDPNFDNSSMITYALLEENASAPEIVADIPNRVAAKYNKSQNDYVEIDLVPMADVYLKSQKYPGYGNVSDIKYMYIFSAIAALVLVIALINYMNLSTARSMERAREVGVRKVVGAVRAELFWQFISESILLSLFAIVLAVLIVLILLPMFNALASKTIVVDFAQHPEWILALLGVWFVVSLLGGAYPAAVLSSFRPAKVLKGKLASLGSGALLRKSLVVFQFSVSIFLIVCTLTISNQLNFMVNRNIGIDKEKLVTINLDSASRANLQTVRNEFMTIPGVDQVTWMSSNPVNIGAQTTVQGFDVGEKQMILHNLGADPNAVKTLGLQVIAGTDLSQEAPKDGRWEYLLNESAVEFFGWTNESAIGRRMNMWQKEGVVKGVIRDFNFSEMHKPIGPLLVHAGLDNGANINKVIVRIHGNNFETTIEEMEKRWKAVSPLSTFPLTFVNESFQNLYLSETRLSGIMNVFSVLAIFIAGLGLFGLASYTIMQRTKELGIRKVLGASFSTLIVVVSRNFILLVIIAFVLAAPISWFVMDNWLQNFAYPVGFDWMIVLGAGIVAIVVAAATVFYHALDAVRVNPAQTLRSE